MGKRRLLIVDDDEFWRIMLNKQLIKEGFETVAVEDGFQAIDEYKKSSFDASLIDLMMPEMGGIELLVKLKEINPNIPVIMLTANDQIDSYLRAQELGAFEYIIKPVDITILKEMLAKTFSSKK